MVAIRADYYLSMKPHVLSVGCILFALSSPGVAAQDGAALIAQLYEERCSWPLDAETEDPQGLTRTVLEVSPDVELNELRLGHELWLGVFLGEPRYAVFRSVDSLYRLVDCIPFHPSGSSSTEIDGQPAKRFELWVRGKTPRGVDLVSALFSMHGDRYELKSAEIIDPFLYEKGIRTWGEPIEDPWYWSEMRFAADGTGGGESMWGFHVDLDLDGEPELGIACTATFGTGGGQYAFFRREAPHYRFLGYLGFKSYQVLPALPGERLRVRTYWSNGGGCGSIATYGHDGSRFVVLENVEHCGAELSEFAGTGPDWLTATVQDRVFPPMRSVGPSSEPGQAGAETH